MRLANQEEEDNEIKDIFEKAHTQTQKTQRSQLASKSRYDSDEESSKIKRTAPTYGSSDENLDEDLVSSAPRPARGCGSRGGRGSRGGGRGSRGGRGAKADTSRANKTLKRANDSDAEIIDMDSDGDNQTSKFSSTLSARKTQPKPCQKISTTSSLRRNRIAYEEDDDDDDDSNDIIIDTKHNNKKSKQNLDEETATTFSIFKRVA